MAFSWNFNGWPSSCQPLEADMAIVSTTTAHKRWEDWVGIGLGVLIILSPVLAGEFVSPNVVLATSIIGLMVAGLAALELVQLDRWEEFLETAFGLALISTPFLMSYVTSGELRWWHIGLGTLVTLLGAYELWQDRKLTTDDFAHSRDE